MKKNYFLLFLAFILSFSTLFSPTAEAQSNFSKKEALAYSVYYSVKDNILVLNEAEALEKNSNITESDIKEINKFLNSMTESDINNILEENGYNLEDVKLENTELAHANIVWFVPIVLIAILATGAIIFTSMYFSYKEKKNLVDKCYSNQGYPVIDSRDHTGIKGKTDGGAAKKAGGYKFTCKKK